MGVKCISEIEYNKLIAKVAELEAEQNALVLRAFRFAQNMDDWLENPPEEIARFDTEFLDDMRKQLLEVE